MNLEVQALAAVGKATQIWLLLGNLPLRFGMGESVLRALVSGGTPETVVAPKWVRRLDHSSPRDEPTEDGKSYEQFANGAVASVKGKLRINPQ